jgi:opacity protein-like surface antigen
MLGTQPIVLAMACAAMLGCSGASLAADTTPVSPWSGFYVGGTTAVTRSMIKGNTLRGDGGIGANASQESALVSDHGRGIGAFIGLRKRFEPGFVAGLEADVTWLDHSARNYNLLAGSSQPVAILKYETPWLATARAVAGWTVGDVMVYGTGGFAMASEVERRTQFRLIGASTVPMFSENAEKTRTGLAIGGGAEWRFSDGWSLRAEALHVRLAKSTFRFPDARGGAQAAFATVQGRLARNSGEMNVFRIGLTYRFASID